MLIYVYRKTIYKLWTILLQPLFKTSRKDGSPKWRLFLEKQPGLVEGLLFSSLSLQNWLKVENKKIRSTLFPTKRSSRSKSPKIILDSLKTEEFRHKVESLRRFYLFIYSLFKFLGYLYIVGLLSAQFLKEGGGGYLLIQFFLVI